MWVQRKNGLRAPSLKIRLAFLNLFMTSKKNPQVHQFKNLKYCKKVSEPYKTPLKWCITVDSGNSKLGFVTNFVY